MGWPFVHKVNNEKIGKKGLRRCHSITVFGGSRTFFEHSDKWMVKDEWMYICTLWIIVKNLNYQKEWHNATKSVRKEELLVGL